jgi:hypothetical protein
LFSADALNPCYKEASLAINLVEPPTSAATVGADQFNCSLTSGSLEGYLQPLVRGLVIKIRPKLVSFSNAASGSSTAAVDMEGSYIYGRYQIVVVSFFFYD